MNAIDVMLKPVSLIWLAAVASSPLPAQIWKERSPRLQWEGRAIDAAEASRLLAYVCKGRVKATTVLGDEKGFGCDDAVLPSQGGSKLPGFRVDQLTPPTPSTTRAPNQIWFHGVSKVIYGHFLSPSSNDAALSGWGGETHPAFWGGTLLLTSQGGEWRPVWYKSAVITRFCRKITGSTGRDLLLCEEEDGGMGHSYHILYVVDFTSPKSPWDSAVFTAYSYLLMCREQQVQSIERLILRPAELTSPFLTVLARHGRRDLSERETEACAQDQLRSSPATRNYQVDFLLGESLVPTLDTARSAALFSVR
jgi:hypothetical protein